MAEGDGFLSLTRKRFSARAYLPRPVPGDKLDRCLEAARLAPSACNAQPWTFVVIDDAETRARLADLTSEGWLPLNHFTKQAPLMIAVVVEPANLSSRFGAWIKKRDFPLIDIGIAAEHFCLQAAEEGLGTCLLGWFQEEKVKSLLGVPRSKRIGLLITLGYPADPSVPAKNRKPLAAMVCRDRYGEPPSP
ncbi:MAG: nitroreductase [Deltaproteobacteria bacterium]|nr:nitroreductase [Deltaproteobacteria bacterium]